MFEFLKNLFNRKNVDTVNLVNKYVSIPTREMYAKDANMLKLIEEEKDNYTSLIKGNVLTSMDLDHADISEELNMYVNLISNIISNQTNIDIFYLINAHKCKLYLENYFELERINNAKIIAITEILNNLSIFNKRKRDALKSELSILVLNKATIDGQKVSLIKEINNNIKMYQYDANQEKEDLLSRKEQVKKDYEFIFKSTYNETGDALEDTAIMENKIEEYIYKHKTLASSYKSELEMISNTKVSKENKDDLIEKLEKIEQAYLIIYEYGIKDINESDLQGLYTTKYRLYSYSNGEIIEPFVNENTNQIELDCYSNIVSKDIEKLIMGKNEHINSLFKEDSINASILIKEIIRNGKEFDLVNVLKDKFLFNLLNSTTYENGLIPFFRNYLVATNLYKDVNFCNPVFLWDKHN